MRGPATTWLARVKLSSPCRCLLVAQPQVPRPVRPHPRSHPCLPGRAGPAWHLPWNLRWRGAGEPSREMRWACATECAGEVRPAWVLGELGPKSPRFHPHKHQLGVATNTPCTRSQHPPVATMTSILPCDVIHSSAGHRQGRMRVWHSAPEDTPSSASAPSRNGLGQAAWHVHNAYHSGRIAHGVTS